ncbi:MAG TPA: MFS transporter [Chitinophaga sp.]|uniref:MFS transporter n=1 Tax=Chitinophaga sp. TaxID=1869181 RepID=UPI002C2A55BF|nr:MFS transporter [Chitinophaga sp.]HVI48816.1 MFS transporter [Chitinophaga sp.]
MITETITIPDRRRWLALVVLSMGAFLSPLDYFIVNIALQAIKDTLHVNESALQLVVAAYGLAYAALVVTGGRLGDIFGRKRVYMTGMLAFTAASAGCAMAPDIRFLIAVRAVQGAAAAMLAPQVLATIRVIFPSAEQPRAMGIFGAVFGVAAIAGQLLGGLLINAHIFGWTWESIFMINIPVGILTILGAAFILEENKPAKRPQLDIAGMLLVTLTLALFIFPLIKGREAGWPLWTFGCMALAVITGILFLYTEQRVLHAGKDPLIHIPLLKGRHFRTGLGVIFLYNHTSAFFVVFPYYLQHALHWDALSAGLAVLPYATGFFAGPLLSARINGHEGVKTVKAGMLLLSTGFLLSSCIIYLTAAPILFKCCLLMAGLGHGIVMPSMLRLVMGSAPLTFAGQASGIVSTAVQTGGVLGGAVLGTLFFTLSGFFSYQLSLVITFAALAAVQASGFLLAIIFGKQQTH